MSTNIDNINMKKFDNIYKNDNNKDDNDIDVNIKFNYLYYSDTIIVSMLDENGDFLDDFIDKVNSIIVSLLLKNIFLRGCIVYDDLYHNDKICFGPAIVEAYNFEQECSIFPRIIIPNKLYYEYVLNKALKEIDLNVLGDYNEFYQTDNNFSMLNNKKIPYFYENDGFHAINFFFDRFAFLDNKSFIDYCKKLDCYKKIIINCFFVKENQKMHYLQKYYYIAEKFNKHCDVCRLELNNTKFDIKLLPTDININEITNQINC